MTEELYIEDDLDALVHHVADWTETRLRQRDSTPVESGKERNDG